MSYFKRTLSPKSLKTVPAGTASSTSELRLPPPTHLQQAVTPLPKFKIFILVVIQLNEAVALVSLTPYVPFMLKELLGTDDDKDPRIGFYAGLLISTFSGAQFVSAQFWGRMSDIVGRRPIILCGMVGNMITMPLFGFSSSITWAFATRFACGILNGNIPVAKTYLSEILDSTNQPKGFAYWGVAWACGLSIGPTFGGALYGLVDTGIWKQYPWLLPNVAAVSITVIVFFIALVHLEETYVPKKRVKSRKKKQHLDQDELLVPLRKETEDEESVYLILLKNRPYVVSVIMYSFVAMLPVSMNVVFPLWAQVSDDLNGWAWDAWKIGVVQGMSSISNLVTNLIVFPRIVKYGLLNIIRCALLIPVVLTALWPLFALIQGDTARFASMMAYQLIWSCGTSLGFTISNMTVPNTVYREILGTANGLAQSMTCIVRISYPLMIGSLFSWGVGNEVSEGFGYKIPFFNRYLPFYIIGFTSFLNILVSFGLPDRFQKPRPPKLKYRDPPQGPDSGGKQDVDFDSLRKS